MLLMKIKIVLPFTLIRKEYTYDLFLSSKTFNCGTFISEYVKWMHKVMKTKEKCPVP